MSKKAVPYLIQGKNIILVIDGKSHTISKDTHVSYAKIVESLKAQDWDALRDLVEPKQAFVKFGKGFVSIEGSTVMWKGKPFHNALATRMIQMFQDGFPVDPMVNLMGNLMENPSKRSVDQVYGFLEKNNLPVTEDGHFLAFKRVAKNYMDIHSGTISNHVGAEVEMDRNLVDDNPDSHCSSGLHFCSISYLSSFGASDDPIMILKINPADVVSIPTDYNGAKGRCSRYTVVAEVTGDPAQAFASVVDNTYTKKAPVAPVAPVVPVAPVFTEVWPFPTSSTPPAGKKVASKTSSSKNVRATIMYDVRRRSNKELIASNVTKSVAISMAEKNIRQKKAVLYITEHGTSIELIV